jgi:hypothetical protein
MILTEKASAHRPSPHRASPLWYVTNGDAVVGPVDTELLLRGITSSRIPNDCMVTQESWGAWRAIDQIRELARISRPFSWAGDHGALGADVSEEMVCRARDAGEALLFAMHAAVKATRATAGLVHRARDPFVGLVTSAARGPGVDEQLGQVIPRHDPVLELAERGEPWLAPIGDAGLGRLEQAIARRFAPCPGELRGVAMVPIFDGGRLLAMIELARVDHAFRGADAGVLRDIADVVCRR